MCFSCFPAAAGCGMGTWLFMKSCSKADILNTESCTKTSAMSLAKNKDKVFTGTQESYQISLLLQLLSFFQYNHTGIAMFEKKEKQIFGFMILKPSTVTYL